MKHLKKFNEELNLNTYKRAATKLSSMGHRKRSANMMNWVDIKQKEEDERKRLEEIEYWKKSISEYSKFGEFKFEISDIPTQNRSSKFEPIVDNFYGSISFESDMFIDNAADEIEYAKSNPEKTSSMWFTLFMVAIPKTEDEYDKYQNIPSIKSAMWRGGIFGLWISFKILIEGDLISIPRFEIYADDGQESRLNISDRATAGKIRNLLLGIFKGTIDYPVKYQTEGYPTNLHDYIETIVCNKSGLTSEYGLNMDHFVEAIQKVSANSLFKES